MNLARSLVSGLRHDITANPDTLRQIIPKELLTYRQAVQACIDEEQQQKTVSRWVEGAIQFRDFNTHYSFYAKQVGASASGSAPPELVWRRLTGLGGSTGYYYLNWLWTLRESIDWVVGGPGRTRGRRAATELRVGDLIDSWRVIAIQPGRSLTLMMGMRAPGAGVLEFKVKPLPDAGCQVDISAHWHPAGFWGMLYWYALTLPHLVLFKGMSKALVK